MKTVLIILIAFITLPSVAQERNENIKLWWSINAYRHKHKLPTVEYKFVAQPSCDKRLYEIQKDFKIPEDGYEEECDGEVILRNESYIGLLAQVTDQSEIHFNPEIRRICVSTTKTDTMYYAVIRLWMR